MSYVMVRASSAARGIIYEKDYRPEIVFGKFVKFKVSQLVGLGLVKEGTQYWAVITPGFDERDDFDDLSWGTQSEAAPGSGAGWLVFRTEDITGTKLMRYFTLELHLARGDANRYRKSFVLSELAERTKQEKETLVLLGATTQNEEVSVDYLAVADGVMRERELLHMPDDLEQLRIGLVVEALEKAEVPEKQMPECNCGHSGQDPGNQLEVLFEADGFSRLRQYLRTYATRAKEIGGILIGEVYRQPGRGKLYIEVEDFIPAEKTEANSVSLRFTHETWRLLTDRKRERFSDKKPVVGWYHTHPPIPATIGGKRVDTVAFFSRDDEIVQQQFFPEPWQIGVVMDAGSDEFAVFRWQESTIVLSESHFFNGEKALDLDPEASSV